jgi:branched-chain amino acid transport system ATP-binding protein
VSILSVSGLTRSFGGVRAVDDLSFDVATGSMTAIIGPNGAGKTTCFNLLNGQLRPDGGRVRLGGKDVTGMRPRLLARLRVGRTFQITATFASMSVRQNVQMALLSHNKVVKRFWLTADRQFRAEAEALLGRVGLSDQMERSCAVLAYGDLKRLELAMALAMDPLLLLMDEPTAGMAAQERHQLMELTADIVRSDGITVLFTEHDMDVVFGHADSIIVMNRGRLLREGTPAEVRADPEVKRVYLGASQ